MYLDSLVKVPEAKGKITFRTKGNTTYVEYESSRIYIPEKKYTTVSRKTIGKLTDADRQFMQPNENFLKFFPDTALPEEKAQAQVSKTKKQYDAAVVVLSDLLDKRDALRRDELVKAIMKSDRTYEEVLEFLGAGAAEEEA